MTPQHFNAFGFLFAHIDSVSQLSSPRGRVCISQSVFLYSIVDWRIFKCRTIKTSHLHVVKSQIDWKCCGRPLGSRLSHGPPTPRPPRTEKFAKFQCKQSIASGFKSEKIASPSWQNMAEREESGDRANIGRTIFLLSPVKCVSSLELSHCAESTDERHGHLEGAQRKRAN